MSTSPKDVQPEHNKDTEAKIIAISTGDLSTLHNESNNENQSTELMEIASQTQTNPTHAHKTNAALSDIIQHDEYHVDISESDEYNANNGESYPLNIKTSKNKEINNDSEVQHRDTFKWYRKGTDRSETAGSVTPATSSLDLSRIPTAQERWEEFVLHLRHAASYRAEFDIYQVLAYRAMVNYEQKIYMKPFKSLKGMISDEWSDLEVRWLNSFQRVLCQAFICFCIQTIGVTVILTTQFTSYFADQSENAQCDSGAERWKTEWHLKLLAFLWTAFIALGVSGWVFKARHSGFYAILIFLKRNQYPNFVSSTILQIGLLTNYYVVTSSVIGSFILIYQTEGGTETIGMILQAVALFFILELDNRIVHSRDFLSIHKYMDIYIKNGKHKKMPHCVVKEDLNCCNKPIDKCRGNTCLSGTLSIVSFILLVIMTFCGFVAPWLIMICW